MVMPKQEVTYIYLITDEARKYQEIPSSNPNINNQQQP
jgi:hypothetical protein